MKRVVIERDGILNLVPVVLDPETPEEHRRAVADYYTVDDPDFSGWLGRVRRAIPGLFPAEVVIADDETDLETKLGTADALIVESFAVGEAELARAPRLKAVVRFGSRTGNVDLEACARRHVAVEVQRRRVNVAVAEQAFAMLLALAKRFGDLWGVVTSDQLAEAGFPPKPYDRRYTGNANFARITGLKTLNEAVLGVIGLGEIGREVASRGHAFGMTVLYHQRRPVSPLEEWTLGASYVGLAELMARSDFISIQLPLNGETRGFLGRDAFAGLKPGAILVNPARADLVDRAALIEALDSGRLAGYGVDVGYAEPYKADDPLLKYPKGKVILLPHTAPASRENGLRDMEEMCLKLWRALEEAPKTQ